MSKTAIFTNIPSTAIDRAEIATYIEEIAADVQEMGANIAETSLNSRETAACGEVMTVPLWFPSNSQGFSSKIAPIFILQRQIECLGSGA